MCIVISAGTSWGAPLVDYPETNGWDKVIALNVKSIFYMTMACLPYLEKGNIDGNIDPARVLIVSSVAGTSNVSEGLVSAAVSSWWFLLLFISWHF